jgi:hypothetical protein
LQSLVIIVEYNEFLTDHNESKIGVILDCSRFKFVVIITQLVVLFFL